MSLLRLLGSLHRKICVIDDESDERLGDRAVGRAPRQRAVAGSAASFSRIQHDISMSDSRRQRDSRCARLANFARELPIFWRERCQFDVTLSHGITPRFWDDRGDGPASIRRLNGQFTSDTLTNGDTLTVAILEWSASYALVRSRTHCRMLLSVWRHCRRAYSTAL